MIMQPIIDADYDEIDGSAVQNAVAKAAQNMTDERDNLNRMIGEIRAFSVMNKISVAARALRIAKVRETKSYHASKGMIGSDGRSMAGTWDEFCRELGFSRQSIELDLQNLDAFGADALDALHAAGLGYRQMRQLRRMPEDGRQALIEAAKTGDKKDILAVAEEFLDKNRAEKEKLQSSLTEADANLKAKEQLLADRNKELIDAKDRLVLIQDARAKENQLRSEIAAKAVEAQSVVTMRLGEGFRLLAETIPESEDEESARERRHFMAEHIKIVKDALEQLQDEYGLPDDPAELEGIPDYAQDDDPEAQAKIAPPVDYKMDEHGRWIAPDQTGE